MQSVKFRYEYRFDYWGDMGIRVQFVKDFHSIEEIQSLANHPHLLRRTWAQTLVSNYRRTNVTGPISLNAHDFNLTYGQVVKAHFPAGAVLSFVEPTQAGQDLLLIIQVSLFILVL